RPQCASLFPYTTLFRSGAAGVVGAEVAVVAVQGRSAGAAPGGAGVVGGAGVAVVAGGVVVRVHAATSGGARVVGTGVPVVAGDRSEEHTSELPVTSGSR